MIVVVPLASKAAAMARWVMLLPGGAVIVPEINEGLMDVNILVV
jgi:hypothetical protein